MMKFKYEISYGWVGFGFPDRKESICDWAYTVKDAMEKIDRAVHKEYDAAPKTWTITEVKSQAIIASGCIIKQEGSDYYSILTERHQILRSPSNA